MDKETEEWIKKINEKSKQRLKEHFEEKKLQRWTEQQVREFSKPKSELHYGDNWEIEKSEFDELNDDFEKSKTNFIDDFIWKDLTNSNDKKIIKKVNELSKQNLEMKEFRNFCSEMIKCRKCFKNNVMQKYYTFYDGNLHSRLMIIGQSPVYPLHPGKPFGLREEKHQHSGSRWLKKCFKDAGLNYMDTYVTNLVKDSPKNNEVNTEMIQSCTPFLKREISMFTGSLILALGSASCNFFNVKNGEMIKYKEKKVYGAYHPSFIKRRQGEPGRIKFIQILKNIKKDPLYKIKQKKLGV